MDTQDLRDRPIECSPGNVTTLDYHRVPFDSADPRWKEQLVNIADFGIGGESFYARTDSFNEPYRRPLSSSYVILCRETVALKLQELNPGLHACGLEVFVWDAFRSIDTQTALWNHFMTVARNIVGEHRTACVRFAEQFCSNPEHFSSSDWTTWPVHCTGGSVDLTLRRLATGELLYMGGIFDDPSPSSATGYLEKKALEAERSGTLLSASDAAALRNRRLLFHAMCAQGFTNYGFEWWHFDFGTQLWALMQSRQSHKRKRHVPNAFYGFVDPDRNGREYQP